MFGYEKPCLEGDDLMGNTHIVTWVTDKSVEGSVNQRPVTCTEQANLMRQRIIELEMQVVGGVFVKRPRVMVLVDRIADFSPDNM